MINNAFKDLEKLRNDFFIELGKLSEKKLNKKYKNNWSINEHLYHVWLAETLTEKYIRKKSSYPEFIKEISFLVYFRTFALRFFLNLGVKVKAPQPTTVFPENMNLNDLNEKWNESRKSFENLIKDLIEKKLHRKAIFRHPLMGRINLKLTLYFFNFHFKHHQKKINFLKNI